MTADVLGTYEFMARNQIVEWHKEKQSPIIAKQIYEALKNRGYPHSERTFKKILGSLRKQRLIQEKIVTNGTHKGVMGYVPAAKEPVTEHVEQEKKIPTWKIEFLTKILKDDDIPEVIKELASYRLRDCCNYDTSIDATGKKILQNFFSDLLDKPRREDKIYSSTFVAFDDFISFHLSDRLDWILDNYYDKLLGLFKTGKAIEFRHRALRCLGQIFYKCQENQKVTKTKELYVLFMNTFFDPSEKEKIVNDAFENMCWKDEKNVQNLVNKLYENTKSSNEVIKTRCLKYLQQKILPIM